MKILHCCLSCFYIDEFGYQENILPKIHHRDGNDVLIIASTETFINGKLGYIQPRKYKTEYGVPIIRLPYTKLVPHALAKKLRVFPDFNQELTKFQPDVILFHGTCGYEIQTVARYKSVNPNVMLYVDCHEAFFNSARNWLSRNLLHRMLYKSWFRRSLPQVKKVLYIGLAHKKYLVDLMNVSEELMEYYPLGGELINKQAKKEYREEIRSKYKLATEEKFFFHSGKIDRAKNTLELLKAFKEVDNTGCKLIISGIISAELEQEFFRLVGLDERVVFIGWLDVVELRTYLAAADIYLQPGSHSATLPNALCVGTPVMVKKSYYYEFLLDNGSGFFVEDNQDIIIFYKKILNDEINLEVASEQAFSKANDKLDYNKLAARLYR